MRPDVGSSRRLIIRSKVDLPAPDRPITPTKRPRSMESETPSTAVFDPKRRVRFSITSMAHLAMRLVRQLRDGAGALKRLELMTLAYLARLCPICDQVGAAGACAIEDNRRFGEVQDVARVL